MAGEEKSAKDKEADDKEGHTPVERILTKYKGAESVSGTNRKHIRVEIEDSG